MKSSGDCSNYIAPPGRLRLGLKIVKPYLAMVTVQIGYGGLFVIAMLSMKHGMSNFVLSVYRNAVATLVIAPFALVLERKGRPKMTLPIFLRVAVLGFIEPVLDQNLYYGGMKYTSATFASAINNSVPAITFIMAIIFRLETVNMKKVPSLAKVIGTVVTLAGAMVMTLYKGPIVDIIRSRGIVHHGGDAAASSKSADHRWVIGTLMILITTLGWASFFILQSFTLEKYPAKLSLTALICLTGTVEGAVATFIFERDVSVWRIGLDSKLLTVVYAGVVCSGIAYYLQGVVIRERGPVFMSAFYPLSMITTAVLGAIVLAEKVHLGSIIGAIFIVIGLYMVVWGKSKDRVKSGDLPSTVEDEKSASSVHELPITGGKSGRCF
ncbi:hypothetical protein SAY87_011518 [Trapa incisa]|uniref:WAT1-related protein n=1 Tax=Trapa incisa TaxID=236973 RepID=A0AAN7JBI6_9MYRT|nr:hypothetical protein SAY87_011518 [Trapa incisa]